MPTAGGETRTAARAEAAARGAGGPADPREKPAGWLPAALAVALAAAVYLNALTNPFVYDDRATVLNNPSLVDLANWRFVLVYSLFRPVVNVSYALDRAVWGFDPFGFHLTSLLLHLVNVVLVHRLAWHAAGDAARARDLEPPASRGFVAFAAASLFAVHPLLTEAVGYVSGRSELLCATFLLAALLLARRWLAGGRRAWLIGALGAFALALGSKETAVVFPFLLLAYDRLCAAGTPAARRGRLWRLHAPLAAGVVAAGLVRLTTLAAEPTATGFSTPWQNVLTQLTVATRYLALLALPAGQSIAHAVEVPASLLDRAALSALALLGLAVGWAAAVRPRWPLVPFGVIWFLLLLAPSSAVPLREPMAEHRVYLASAGVLLIAGLALASGPPAPFRTSAGRAARGWETGRGDVLVVLLVALGWTTVARNRVWASPISLWADAAAAAPGGWEPHYQLGDALREGGRCIDAIEEYRLVTSLRPSHRDAFNNLGICLAEVGRIGEARQAFDRALAIDPAFARAHNNLGALALVERDADGAREQFERVLALDPDNIVARRQLAALLETVFDEPAEAARLCREILALDPRTPGAAECAARNEARVRSRSTK